MRRNRPEIRDTAGLAARYGLDEARLVEMLAEAVSDGLINAPATANGSHVWFLDEVDGWFLRHLRESLGVQQQDVAEALEVSQSYLSRMERGLHPVKSFARAKSLIEQLAAQQAA